METILFAVFIGLPILFVLILLLLVYLSLPKRIPFYFNGKHALVTGASKGIGKEVAFTLITRGCSVSLIARSIGPLKAAVSEMNTYAHSIQSRAVARYFVLDVSQEYHVIEATVKRIVDEVGPIDVLINNAGTCCQGAFDSLPICEFEAQLKINYLSSVYVTRAVLPYMKESRSGSISFVCTAAAQCPIWGYTAYSASKGALRCFAESLRMEMLPLGIGVCIIYPANTDTEGFQEELKTTPDVVRALSSSAGLLSAKSVAVCLLDNIAVGNATAYVGLQGWILGLLSAGGASESSFFQSSLQVLFGGLLRAVMLISIGNFNEIVHKCLKN